MQSIQMHVVLLFFLLHDWLYSASCVDLSMRDFKGQSGTCGIVLTDTDDRRQWAPWSAVIFIRSPGSRTAAHYYTTGVLIGPSLVLTVVTGAFGAVPAGTQELYYKLPSASSFLVAVGLPTTNLQSYDNNTQMSEVYYVLPYYDENSNHVTGREDLMAEKTANAVIALSGYMTGILDNTRTPRPAVVGLQLESSSVCQKAFNYYRQGLVSDSSLQCARLTLPQFETPVLNGAEFVLNEGVCSIFYGASIGTLYGDKKPVFLTSMLVAKPFFANRCWEKKLAFFADLTSPELNHWLNINYECSPQKFSCWNATCIPLSKACNGVNDCANGEDENRIFCNALLKCPLVEPKSNETFPTKFACGPEGTCLSRNQICDGLKDCKDGSDERSSRCGSHNQQSIMSQCPPLIPDEEIEYLNSENQESKRLSTSKPRITGTTLIARCKPHHKPVYAQDHAKIVCDTSGQWIFQAPFRCIRDCGLILPNEERFPWFSSAVSPTKDMNGFKNICGGTYMEKRYLITSTSCLRKLNESGHFSFTSFFLNHSHVKLLEEFTGGEKFWLSVYFVGVQRKNLVRVGTMGSKSNALFVWLHRRPGAVETIPYSEESDVGIALIKLKSPVNILPWLEGDKRQVSKNWFKTPSSCYLPDDNIPAVVMGAVGKVSILLENEHNKVALKNMTIVPCPGYPNNAGIFNWHYFCIDGFFSKSEKLKDGHGFFLYSQPSGHKPRFYLRGIVLGRLSHGDTNVTTHSGNYKKTHFIVLSLDPFLHKIIDFFELNYEY